MKIEIKLREGGGVYVVETFAPAGSELQSHRHHHDHVSALVSGHANLFIDGECRPMRAYESLVIPAGVAHKVVAITDIMWQCIWSQAVAPRKEMNAFMQEMGCAACPGGCEPADELDALVGKLNDASVTTETHFARRQCPATRFTTDDGQCTLPEGHDGFHNYE
jgi:quercetin dioxygenase-like cupin family protein